MTDTATVIGENMRVVGSLSGDEDLNVFGYVEGTIRLTESLLVEMSGIVRANVAVRSAAISGVVVGNITASEAVEITADGRMVGDITAPRVVIADGAAFKGHIEMTEVNLEDAETTSSRASRGRARPATTRRSTARTTTATPTRAARPTPAPAKPAAEKPAPAKPAPAKPAEDKPAEPPAEKPVAEKTPAKDAEATRPKPTEDVVEATAKPRKTRRRKKAST